jgi:hypothetical protein
MKIVEAVPLKVAHFTPSEPQRFIQIDEDGYFKMEDQRVTDSEIGRDWLSKVEHDGKNFRVRSHIDNQDVIIESFDAPYLVLTITHEHNVWSATMPYGHSESFALETLTLDEWDRFHGRTERGIPFVFSRSAQASFFDLLDSFDDDSIEADGHVYDIKSWPESTSDSSDVEFWSHRYLSKEMPWDLNGAHPSLPKIAAAVKLQRSRILVLGCGRAHDAAWFARAGHIVTAIDYSHDAIKEAKELYGDVTDLTLLQGDAFHLPAKFEKSFDVVFDHTMYCAIDPLKRNDLVKTWRKVLIDDGHLIAIMFCSEKQKGPPYGGSEWELRSRFSKVFRSLYWQRLKDSPPARLGSEIFIYSQKPPALS